MPTITDRPVPTNPLRWLAANIASTLAHNAAPGCAVRDPIPAAPGAVMLYGTLAGVAAVVTGHTIPAPNSMPRPVFTITVGILTAIIVRMILGRLLGAAGIHSHCSTCGRCSVHAGVPAARSTADATAALEAAGWHVDPRPRSADDRCPTCPAQRQR